MADDATGFMWDLNAEFKARLQKFVKESGGRVQLISGFRSPEAQQRLYNAAVAKYGASNAGRWAAVPGTSNHESGMAGDIAFASDADKEWAHNNAQRFGLEFPMEWEPWHIEPAGLANGTFDKTYTPKSQAYTFYEGKANPQDNSDRLGMFGQVLQNTLSFSGGLVEPNPPPEDNSQAEMEVTDGGTSVA